MATTYVVEDRTTADTWAIQITNGVLEWVVTSDPAEAEPELVDSQLGDTLWRLYVDDGQLGWERVLVTGLALTDTATSTAWTVRVTDGKLTWEASA